MLEGLLLDARGHHPGCPQHGKSEPPVADQTDSHLDLFCDCHDFAQPMILKNETDIAWPAGWDADQAAAWRAANDLARPSPIH